MIVLDWEKSQLYHSKNLPTVSFCGKTEMSGISPYFVVLRESHWLLFKGTNVPTVGSADHLC